MVNVAKTYNLLFSGACSSHLDARSHSAPNVEQGNHLEGPMRKQSSLHNFWTIPSLAPATSAVDISVGITGCRRCEDCDEPLAQGLEDHTVDSMDMDMADFGCEGEDARCMTCKRMVCVMCAVVETGMGRECLGCRMR